MTGKSITTKVGDRGTTFLFSGEEVSKDSERIDTYGDLDELVSVLGVARSVVEKIEVRERLVELQRKLFVVGAELATTAEHVGLLKERIGPADVEEFDKIRESLEFRIVMPTGFILPGGTPGAAHIDHARTIGRRCERKIVALSNAGLVQNPDLLIWMNRLSDFLWLLARLEEGDAMVLKDV